MPMKRFDLIIASVCLILFALGCGSDSESETIQPQIHLLMAPGFARQVPDRVEIRVTDQEGEKRESRSEPPFDFSFEVIPGTITIAVTTIFGGVSVSDIKEDIKVTRTQNQIYFLLDTPGVLAVGLDSDHAFPIPKGEEFAVYVYVRNVKNLYGAAVRLRYNHADISPTQIEHNTDFWGTSGENFIAISEYPDKIEAVTGDPDKTERLFGETAQRTLRAGELNIAWTRQKTPISQNGDNEKERLATVHFTAKQATTDPEVMIELVVVDENQRAVFKLQDQNGKELEGFSQLKASPIRYEIEIR
jgi:hypothetical protein